MTRGSPGLATCMDLPRAPRRVLLFRSGPCGRAPKGRIFAFYGKFRTKIRLPVNASANFLHNPAPKKQASQNLPPSSSSATHLRTSSPQNPQISGLLESLFSLDFSGASNNKHSPRVFVCAHCTISASDLAGRLATTNSLISRQRSSGRDPHETSLR